MTILRLETLLPSEMPTALNFALGDSLVIQKSGEDFLSQLDPTKFQLQSGGFYLAVPGEYSTSPTYSYADDTDTGICFYAANTLGFVTGGTMRAYFGGTGNFRPHVDNTYVLGGASNRWSIGWFYDVYSHDGGVETSDEREKADIQDCDLGLDFVCALRPISYRWAEKDEVEVPEKGEPVKRKVPGVRRHYGIGAQQVKSVLGDKDFAGYIDIDRDGSHLGLRYSQFIAPLITAVQQLHAQVKAERQARLALAQRLAALEMALAPIGAKEAKG
jgi:hypothetical protein